MNMIKQLLLLLVSFVMMTRKKKAAIEMTTLVKWLVIIAVLIAILAYIGLKLKGELFGLGEKGVSFLE